MTARASAEDLLALPGEEIGHLKTGHPSLGCRPTQALVRRRAPISPLDSQCEAAGRARIAVSRTGVGLGLGLPGGAEGDERCAEDQHGGARE